LPLTGVRRWRISSGSISRRPKRTMAFLCYCLEYLDKWFHSCCCHLI
jgi:hypothetical protein